MIAKAFTRIPALTTVSAIQLWVISLSVKEERTVQAPVAPGYSTLYLLRSAQHASGLTLLSASERARISALRLALGLSSNDHTNHRHPGPTRGPHESTKSWVQDLSTGTWRYPAPTHSWGAQYWLDLNHPASPLS